MGTGKPDIVEECLQENAFNQEEAEMFIKIMQIIKDKKNKETGNSLEQELDQIITELVSNNEV